MRLEISFPIITNSYRPRLVQFAVHQDLCLSENLTAVTTFISYKCIQMTSQLVFSISRKFFLLLMSRLCLRHSYCNHTHSFWVLHVCATLRWCAKCFLLVHQLCVYLFRLQFCFFTSWDLCSLKDTQEKGKTEKIFQRQKHREREFRIDAVKSCVSPKNIT